MSELLKTLQIIRALGAGRLTSAELQEGMGMSRATLNRHLAEARHLGAQIQSVQGNRVWCYELTNWQECRKIVTRWIELEEARTVLE